MKTGFILSLVLLFCSPSLLPARAQVGQMETVSLAELPWSTVQAVLKKVETMGHYTYTQLVNWYSVGLVTVEQVDSVYVVRIYDEDGLTDVILMDNM